MLEKHVERALRKAVKSAGGWALKFTSPGTAGVPDRILLMRNGRIAFAELKAPGERLRPLQERRKSQLEELGFRVFVIDHPDQIKSVLEEITRMDGGDS